MARQRSPRRANASRRSPGFSIDPGSLLSEFGATALEQAEFEDLSRATYDVTALLLRSIGEHGKEPASWPDIEKYTMMALVYHRGAIRIPEALRSVGNVTPQNYLTSAMMVALMRRQPEDAMNLARALLAEAGLT